MSISVADFARLTNDFLPPSDAPAPIINEENAVIAPWLVEEEDEPPTPPPKQTKFGFSHKPSFSSFGIPRQGSISNLSSRGRPSESSLTDSYNSNQSEFFQPPSAASSRKVRPNFSIIPRMIKKRSLSRLAAEADRSSSPPPPVPYLNQTASYTSASVSTAYSTFHPLSISPPPPSSRRGKVKGKQRANNVPPPLPPKEEPREPELTLDTNLEEMDGIIDRKARPSSSTDPLSSSPSSGLESPLPSSSYGDSFHPISSSPPPSMFSNPFPLPAPSVINHRPPLPPVYSLLDKISPKTSNLPMVLTAPTPIDGSVDVLDGAASWEAPESWAVEKDGEDPAEPDYSSSEESMTGRPVSVGQNHGVKKSKAHRSSTRPKPPSKVTKQSLNSKTFKIRIYRADNSYHVASIGLSVTVADLTPIMNMKLLQVKERETHRLYLKERGRERILAQTERPADIVRRRLEQAGYDFADGLDLLGAEDISFLMKFVYKTQLLGVEEDLSFDTFEHVNLTGRSLRAIPVILHTQADAITTLNLSRNPMLEIPLDFIQSCTTLRELRLSNMAMKRVPQSVRHSVSLYRLDLSCNRIVELNEAGLDQIPKLATLNVQNNRIEKLPWYFPRLRLLRHLNISNNKFRSLPDVVCEMDSLVDLDISFNMISELPEKIGELKLLDRLTIVGNRVSKFPDECSGLVSLRDLDCRRNNISDLSVVCMLPKLEILRADHNVIHALDLSLGPSLKTLDASHNDITQITLAPGPTGCNPYALTSLDISHAKLSSLDEFALGQLSSLETLKLDHNSFRYIPESLGELSQLKRLSCSDNALDALPSSIGRLQRLEILDAHNNSLLELPASVWNCASLCHINVTSNQLGIWHDPPTTSTTIPTESALCRTPVHSERKTSTAGSIGSQSGRTLPPLAHSLERLYVGENNLTDDVLHPFTILKELRVLNLSFNEIQDIPQSFLKNLTKLEELYLSGNKLTSIPTEDLYRMNRLSVLFLNGNRLQTLPHELGKIHSLSILDVGSNILRYNINNWKFDWNWNFNTNLRYLNLSGNKRLEIRPDATYNKEQQDPKVLADFSSLTQLRVLGLMDVTTTFATNIPDDNEDRRVRTSLSEVNNMAYGIADHLGGNDHLNMLDLVQPNFRDQKEEAVFAMFGRTQPSTGSNRLSKYLHDKFLSVFCDQLAALDKSKKEGVPDALRRSFLRLNKYLHDELYNSAGSNRKMSQASATSSSGASILEQSPIRSGASGIVVYISGKTMYVANAGNALAVISRQGAAHLVSRKHDPFDRIETARIRAAEGWVSPKGFVNDEIDISRSFGFYHLLPVVNARPHICVWELTESDEFVIIGNRGLWDYISYQTAVDIARSERADPMIAAQKLRDFAISYGAKGSTMIMVINVSDLSNHGRVRQPTVDSIGDYEIPSSVKYKKAKETILDPNVRHLPPPPPAPRGHVAVVFTDIVNSTHLWETNAGMHTAIRLHNTLLRRQLRFMGGYEVKTEGDAFMCAFPTALSALLWCLTVQVQLLQEAWPLEILECDDGRTVYDASGVVVARGLSVRMGIHVGLPVCEIDPVTQRMDYFGPMVNRSSRINGSADGGQIMCSADIIREINARIFETGPYTEYSDFQPPSIIDAIHRMAIKVIPQGEFKLKGLEVPEVLSLVYPAELVGRHGLERSGPGSSATTSKVQFSIDQIRQLGLICLRLEALSSSRIFRELPARKGSTSKEITDGDQDEERPLNIMHGDPNLLLPPVHDKLSDPELMSILDSLSMRIENALMTLTHSSDQPPSLLSALQRLDERTLQDMLSMLHRQRPMIQS